MSLSGSRHVHAHSHQGHGERCRYHGHFHGISGNVRYNRTLKGMCHKDSRVDGRFVAGKGALVKAIRNEEVCVRHLVAWRDVDEKEIVSC